MWQHLDTPTVEDNLVEVQEVKPKADKSRITWTDELELTLIQLSVDNGSLFLDRTKEAKGKFWKTICIAFYSKAGKEVHALSNSKNASRSISNKVSDILKERKLALDQSSEENKSGCAIKANTD